MDPKLIQSISKKVYQRFPEIDGKKPKIRKQNLPKSKSTPEDFRYLLIFRGNGKGPGGRTIPRLVRVVTNQSGKILKITTSRG